MDKLKPVAWKCERNDSWMYTITGDSDFARFNEDYGRKVTPLYELPEGHVIVPVEKVKQDKQGHG